MFDKVLDAVQRLNDVAPRPNMEPLSVSEAYDLESDWPSKSWYGATKPGVYIFVDSKGEVLYIGKASCGRNIGNRLSAYWRHSPERKAAPKDDIAKGVRYVLTVTVDREFAFEVPAIEEWLIGELLPARNKQAMVRI